MTNDLGGNAANWGPYGAIDLKVAPGTDTVYARVGNVGIFASKDGGTHWTSTAAPPETSGTGGTVFTSMFVFDPKDPQIFWIGSWHGYGDGLLKTIDGGKTFQRLGGTLDKDKGIEGVSVDFTDPARKTIVIAEHEKGRVIMISMDGGATWKNIGANLPKETHGDNNWPLLFNPNAIVVNGSTTGGASNTNTFGIWRSENLGETWTRVSDLSSNSRGAPLLTSKGYAFYPLKTGLARTTDAGKTWVPLNSPTEGSIIELSDGRLAGKGGGYVQISSDNGEHWSVYGPKLPMQAPGALAYLPEMKALMIAVPHAGKGRGVVWRLNTDF